jgi:O-antigen ligase
LILSACALSALFVIASSWNRQLWVRFKHPIVVLLAFFVFTLISVVLSKNNLLVGIFGTKGRSTGLVTYLSLTILFFASILIQNKKSYSRILHYLLIAGFVNLTYNFVYMAGADPIPWNNPYGTILGTFGNPNFISSFLGIVFSIAAVYVLNSEGNKFWRLAALIALPTTFFQILYSRSIQGIFVSAVSTSVVVFFYLRARTSNKKVLLTYSTMIFAAGILSVLGMLQKGPLASLIYKTSVSLRGEYWAAGFNMGINNPLTGVGLDSYGNWYRFYRRPSAMELPGPNVVSDSAHNVFFDFFASGGFPLLIAYLLIQLLVVQAIWKIYRSSTSFSPTPVALIAGWVGYTAQSVISINQIGLAIWGWVLGGSIIGYSMLNRDQVVSNQKNTKSAKVIKQQRSEAAVSLSAVMGLVVGLMIALPPVRTDMAWRAATKSANAGEIEKAMSMWPRNPTTLNSGIVMFANNGLAEKALEWARVAAKENSENFVSLYTLYQLLGDSDSEKSEIYKKLHELDPLNPEFQK